MKELEEKILSEGEVYEGGVLKVSGFLNHRIDVDFLMEIGKEIARLYKGTKIDKILTIEASGIAIAVAAASFIHVPVVFAKKSKTNNISSDVYSSKVFSFTHKTLSDVVVSKDYLSKGENVLIVDDFLAMGGAFCGLMDLVEQAGGNVVGVSAAIEKGFQGGGDELRKKGVNVQSLAVIESMENGKIVFRK